MVACEKLGATFAARVRSDIHPGGPIRAAGISEFGVLFLLAGEKPDLVRLICSRQDRLFQRGFRAEDFVAGSRTGMLIIAAPVYQGTLTLIRVRVACPAFGAGDEANL